MAIIYLIKTIDNHFIPSSDEDYEKVRKFKAGEVYKGDIKKPRNIKFHRKFFALINTIYDIQRHFDNIKALRYWLTMKAGYFQLFIAPNGENVYIPDSISFDKMDGIAFEDLFNKVIDIAISHDKICLGNTQKEIEHQVDKVLGYA